MTNRSNTIGISSREIVFQIVLHLLVFIFYSFDRNHPYIDFHQFVFFLNYTLGAFVINYFILSRFLYPKKYLQFFISVVIILVLVIIIEELVLEKIYFPDTRGKKFSNLFFTMLDVLPVITILSGFKFAWDALGKQREVEQLKDAVKESELQFLKSQINPHFLFNNLNNLYAYAIENSPKTPEIILELSGVLRYMLYECKEDDVLLTKEVAQLENFIKLSELQIEERGKVSFSSQQISADYHIAPLILIVFIENAFKHSTASQTDAIFIDVQLKLSPEGVLEFTCKNSYQPQSNTNSLSQGIGLENVKKRLELLYPGTHQLKIINDDNWYEVHLVMELKKTTVL